MQVYRTEYYESKLGKWVAIYEGQNLEQAKDYFGMPVFGNPPQRIALYERSGVRKMKYQFIRKIM